MFNAHASAIRCLALSPASSSKRTLASGGTDERVNLYHLNTRAPIVPSKDSLQHRSELSSSLGIPSEAPRNKELGTLLNHAQAVTALSFPRHSKLLSASADNNIAVTRTRDWQLLSTIHAPIPKTAGRPSGDTFAPGEVPAGINDLAVHPSARLALTVGIGEKCMRLWNLVTGKKAGVLTFEKPLLAEIGEAKYRGGEARRVVWRPDGQEFAVGFEKGLLVYGVDCQVRGVISLGVRGRVCQVRYVPSLTERGEDKEADGSSGKMLLAVSTEDGRVIFYDTEAGSTPEGSENTEAGVKASLVPHCKAIAQLGEILGQGNRIKDFEIVSTDDSFIIITAGSDGTIRLWTLKASSLVDVTPQPINNGNSKDAKVKANGAKSNKDATPPTTTSSPAQAGLRQVGKLLGSLETNRRITCMVAFLMTPSDGTESKVGKEPEASALVKKSGSHKKAKVGDEDEFGGFDD